MGDNGGAPARDGRLSLAEDAPAWKTWCAAGGMHGGRWGAQRHASPWRLQAPSCCRSPPPSPPSRAPHPAVTPSSCTAGWSWPSRTPTRCPAAGRPRPARPARPPSCTCCWCGCCGRRPWSLPAKAMWRPSWARPSQVRGGEGALCMCINQEGRGGGALRVHGEGAGGGARHVHQEGRKGGHDGALGMCI